MARSRWMFWFRLPWFSGPEDPRPSSTPSEPPNETESNQSLQTRATHQPPDKVEPQIPLSTRVTKQPPKPSLQTRASSQAPDKAEPQILSPTQATSQPPDKVKPPPPPKEPSTTEEISQPHNKVMNQENPQSTKPTQEPKSLEVTTASPEKGIEPPGATFSRGFPSPKAEVGPRSLEGHSGMLRGTNHDDPKGKKKANAQVSSLKERPKENTKAQLDEEDRHPEEVLHTRKPFKTFTDVDNQEKETRFPHKTAMERERPSPRREKKVNSSTSMHKLGEAQSKQPLRRKIPSTITLAGDNTGATMHLSSESSDRERSIHIQRRYKSNPYGSFETTNYEEGSSRKGKFGDSKLYDESAKNLCVNSNVQGINNSLALKSSATERNPGVQMVATCDPEETIKPRKQRETAQTHKAEVVSDPAERL